MPFTGDSHPGSPTTSTTPGTRHHVGMGRTQNSNSVWKSLCHVTWSPPKSRDWSHIRSYGWSSQKLVFAPCQKEDCCVVGGTSALCHQMFVPAQWWSIAVQFYEQETLDECRKHEDQYILLIFTTFVLKNAGGNNSWLHFLGGDIYLLKIHTFHEN